MKLQKLADEVAESLGSGPVTVVTDLFSKDAAWDGYQEVVTVPFYDELVFSDFAMQGVFAHELGHRDLGHVAYMWTSYSDRRRMEEEADAYAAQHSFALQLAEALGVCRDAFGDQGSGDEHPPVAERIAKLQGYEPAKGVGA